MVAKVQQDDIFSRAGGEPQRERQQDDIFSRAGSGPQQNAASEGAPSPELEFTPQINLQASRGASPLTRGYAELMSDNPEELNLWARRQFGSENARIVRGRSLGFTEEDPEYNALFLSPDADKPFQIFDPTQGMAVERAREGRTGFGANLAGLGGRAGEILAETTEVGIGIVPELAAEAVLLAATRGRTAPGAFGKIAQLGGWRMRGAARAGYMGGVAGGAAAGSSALQQIMQEYGGTQAESFDEQVSNASRDALYSAAFSLGGSALKFGGYLGVDALLGQTSEAGARTLAAATEFNRLARAGEDVAPLVQPLVASTSSNPVTKATYNFLARMSPEIAEYNQRLRASLLQTARMRADARGLAPDDEIRLALQDQYDTLRQRILFPSTATNSVEAGQEAAAYLGAFAEETYSLASQAYDDVFERMADEGGDYLTLVYDFSSLRNAIRNGEDRRVLQRSRMQEDTGQPGLGVNFEEDPIRLQPGLAESWSVFNETADVLEGITRGQTRVPPQTLVRLIQDINDQLTALGPDATDAGTRSLRALKRGLNDALDSLPSLNEGRFSQETIDGLRSANRLFAQRSEILDSAGVLAIMRHANSKDWTAAAATLYNGNLSTVRNVRDAILQTSNGQASWDQMRNNYLAYALNTGAEGSAFANWRAMPPEIRREMFSADERSQIGGTLRQIDALINDTGFRDVIDAADETGTFLDTLLQTATAGQQGRPRAVQQVGEALRAANVAGNPAPQRAFTAGVWDHLLRQSGVIARREGEESISSRSFGRALERLERTGVLDLLPDEDRQFINQFSDLIATSDTELGSSGSSIAVAQMISEIAGGRNLASNMGRLLSSKLASNALILGNRGLQGLESAVGGRRGVNVQTALARTAYHYALDQNAISSEEWREFEAALQTAQPENILNPAQR